MRARAWAVFVSVIVAGCGGGEAQRPARRARPSERPPETLRETQLRSLEGECGPDRRPLDVPEEGYASEMWLADGRAHFQIARRVDRGVLGAVCSRPVFEGETALEVDVIETILGQTPVLLVVDIAHLPESDITVAWVLDRELRYIGAVYDDQGGSASVEANTLVIGGAKRTLRGGTLVAP